MSQGNNGWIELHRNMLENPIVMKSAEHCAIWTCLLLLATHKEMDVIFDGKKITLKPGQFITGRKSLASLYNKGLSESKVQRILKDFENEHQIEQQTCTRNRLITIVNWNEYQKIEQAIEQRVNNKRTTTEQQLNTNNNVIMKKDSIYNTHFEEVWNIYPRKQDKSRSYQCYMARINSGFSEEELLLATKEYANECEQEHRDKKYIKMATTFFGVNTPFVDYLPKKQNTLNKINTDKIFDLSEQENAPYFGFPKEWFDGTSLIREKMTDVVQPKDTSKGRYEDREVSVDELIELFEIRRKYAYGENGRN
jgi:molybdopterin-biosynthesis enzyme MoeA-like protein